MELKCDILIIGAGVAGSVAAHSIPKKKFNVIVIEKEPYIGAATSTKIDVTEDIGLTPIIEELNLPFLCKTNKTHWHSPNDSFTLDSEIHDIYFKRGPDRDSFENQVMKKAVKKGVKLLLNTKIKRINCSGGGITSVETNHGLIKSKIVIAADGTNSKIPSQLGISEKKIATFLGYGIYAENLKIPQKETHIFIDRKNAPGGYFFMAKDGHGKGVACMVVDQQIAKRTPKWYYHQIIKENTKIREITKKAKILNEITGKGQASRLQRLIYGNTVLVGEAGRLLDPLLGYGMKNAIISGYYSAKMVENYLSGKSINLVNYNKRINQILIDGEENTKARKIFRKLSNKNLERVIRTLKETDYSNLKGDLTKKTNLIERQEEEFIKLFHLIV